MPPTIRAAAVDGAGNLWVSFVAPYTYVYDRGWRQDPRACSSVAPASLRPSGLFFGVNGRLLVTPGLLTFEAVIAAAHLTRRFGARTSSTT